MADALRLDWTEAALADLEELTAYMLTATARAEADLRRMAHSGFNYGRRVPSQPEVWYWPGDAGVYYTATPTTLRVLRVVDARLLRQRP